MESSILIVNRSAFSEQEPLISFAGGCDPITVSNCVPENMIKYRTEKFGWFPSRVYSRCIRLKDCSEPAGKDISDVPYCAGVTLEGLREKFAPRSDEAMFIDCGEKEYSAEVCHVTNGKVKTLLRYSVDGMGQVETVISVPVIEETM